MGWNLALANIHRSTWKGAPAYQETDLFVGIDGEVLQRKLNHQGTPESQRRNMLLGVALPEFFTATVWRSRIDTDFNRLEYWVPDSAETSATDFWVLYHPDGTVSLFGRNPPARLSNPQDPSQTAAWLLESSVSPTGEQIYYQYRSEDEQGCDPTETAAHPHATAQRYLSAVCYGNLHASRTLPGLCAIPPSHHWLFILVVDYGERSTALNTIPAWQATATWPSRPDCFSSYEYGFELRTRRLGRQILMFHRLATLADPNQAPGGDTPTLVMRMLLEYDERPSVSTLISVRQVAYEPEQAPQISTAPIKPVQTPTIRALPPLEFGWQVFTPPGGTAPSAPLWELREDLGQLNPQQPWQLIDLNGEGLAGVLYQDDRGWWWRAPIRQTSAITPADDSVNNAVTWSSATPLPKLPTLQESGALIDLNGDGRLEWVVTNLGAIEHYDRLPTHEWLHFTPLTALPIEYQHPHMQLTDLLGGRFTDMVLIGPRSVRLYANNRQGWDPGQTVAQSDHITLPIPGADPQALVVFTDIMGSGQQHLVRIRADGVRVWPNLGHGRFGSPLDIPGFTQPLATFHPNRVFLADIDGSGAPDLIYVQTHCLQIYRNQSGNRFAPPFEVPLPAGAHYDATCQLQIADIQGLGVASILLCVPHPTPRHWICHLTAHKPWLLNSINNNMGAHHTLHYRSSAQFWLDEKQAQPDVALPCYLPFALHTLSRQQIEDEITGNRLVHEFRYRHGVWDGRYREFRGFGYVETYDTNLSASQPTAPALTLASLSRAWFATGMPEVDQGLSQEYWQADTAAFARFSPRFTQGDGNDEHAITPDDDAAFWLHRALKGLALRQELYGVDASGQPHTVPYSVTENRLQARLLQRPIPAIAAAPTPAPTQRYSPASPPASTVRPIVVESRRYVYDQIAGDPQCQQDILLRSDAYGHPLQQMSIHYPRRPKPAKSPYPDTLPETLFDSSYDAQQQVLRLTLQQNSWHHLQDIASGVWLLGLAYGGRTDAWLDDPVKVPAAGITLETLQSTDNPIGNKIPSATTFIGQQLVWYLDANTQATQQAPAFPARVSFIETAILDENITRQLVNELTPERLQAAGYRTAPYLFVADGEEPLTLWVARHSHTEYAGATHFWHPTSFRQTLLTGAVTVTRDRHDCVITQYQDAAGLTTQAQYDYRFLVPVRLVDPNNNVHTTLLDALGRVISNRFRGTENGQPAGYSDTLFVPPETVDAALALKSPLPIAHCQIYIADSWMPTVDLEMIQRITGHDYPQRVQQQLIAAYVLTEDSKLRALAAQRPLSSEMTTWLVALRAAAVRLPPHALTLTTDRYDDDAAQQIRQQVAFSDGFTRLLQSSVRQVAGRAWQRTPDGGVVIGIDGDPQEAETNFRWAVSGRTEYDNKGQAVRTYQPYFLNEWRYISDDSARSDLYADTHFYDAIGRVYQVTTAKGWLKRTLFTPWFDVHEDENDTAAEVMANAAPPTSSHQQQS
jgi:hypothetical protein